VRVLRTIGTPRRPPICSFPCRPKRQRARSVARTAPLAAGDELLTAVAAAFAKRLRTTDIVARLGGDEFVLLLPKADVTEVTIVAGDLGRIVRDIGARYPLEDSGVSASIGAVVLADVEVALEREALLSAADIALYRAKASGRDTIQFAQAALLIACRGSSIVGVVWVRGSEHFHSGTLNQSAGPLGLDRAPREASRCLTHGPRQIRQGS
jgi:hypothetical protein